jgi:hypothetical protein
MRSAAKLALTKFNPDPLLLLFGVENMIVIPAADKYFKF